MLGANSSVRKFTKLHLRCPRTMETSCGSSSVPAHRQPLTNAGDTVLSQHGPMVAEADDFVALGVHVALDYLAVAAV